MCAIAAKRGQISQRMIGSSDLYDKQKQSIDINYQPQREGGGE